MAREYAVVFRRSRSGRPTVVDPDVVERRVQTADSSIEVPQKLSPASPDVTSQRQNLANSSRGAARFQSIILFPCRRRPQR